jgi:mono/diheme cytochrome c family protein
MKDRAKTFALFCLLIFAAATLAANLLASKTIASGEDVSGKDLFKNNCGRCHGADGAGGKGPNLTTAKKQAKWHDSDEKLIAKIAKGAFRMPAFAGKLKPEEIKAVADYVRSFKPQDK